MNGQTHIQVEILQALSEMQQQLGELKAQIIAPQNFQALSDDISNLRDSLEELRTKKDFYSTRDVATMMGVSLHTVQERWCNQARIASEKDPESGQWRIPDHEYERLRRGGKPLSNRSIPS